LTNDHFTNQNLTKDNMHTELHYQIALTQVPNIGCVRAKILVDNLGSAEAVFKAKRSTLETLDGIGTVRANDIKSFQNFKNLETEVAFVEKYKIQPLFINDKHYPQRLLNCFDSPTLLYYRGDANLNTARILAIIGSRSHTDYGKTFTEKLIKELSAENILVVSGLAFGIDTIAHKASLKNNLSTVGVLAHGLDILYPPENAKLAKQMVSGNGGILTEFMSGTKPDRHNFPTRNRIVAGMADATIVIETDIKGGSMITAGLANNYNRDVFALPGKTTDIKSRGCNHLIRNNRADLLTSAQDILEMMGWLPQPEKKKRIQRTLFIELTENEKIIVDLLNAAEQLPIDELYAKSQLSTSSVAAALLNLEMQALVIGLPGKVYKLV
jgi:DNA processing protein